MMPLRGRKCFQGKCGFCVPIAGEVMVGVKAQPAPLDPASRQRRSYAFWNSVAAASARRDFFRLRAS